MSDAPNLRVFIASPGDCSRERERVRQVIDEVSLRNLSDDLSQIETVGWEQVPGTARRPQEVINDDLRRCDYLIVLLKDNWGSEPGSRWGYSSGTEEELFTGLLELQDRHAPMRDVFIIFLEGGTPSREIAALRDQLNTTHGLMYEPAASEAQLVAAVKRRVHAWAKDISPKQPRHVPLTPSSGQDVLAADAARRDGLKLADMGLLDEAADKLSHAASFQDPAAMLDYARFLARGAKYDAAKTLYEKVIKLQSSTPGAVFSGAAAEAYSSLGKLAQRQGDPTTAIHHHRCAIDLISGGDIRSRQVSSDVYDALGLAYQDAGSYSDALVAFEKAIEIRSTLADPARLAQSHVNIGRRKLHLGDLASGAAHSETALALLRDGAPSPLLANATVLRAQLYAAENDYTSAIDSAQEALALNRQFGNRAGQAVCLNVIAQNHLAKGEMAAASTSAQYCLELNVQSRNPSGQAAAHHLLAKIARTNRDWSAVRNHLTEEVVLRHGYRVNRYRQGWIQAELAEANLELGDFDRARAALTEARAQMPMAEAELREALDLLETRLADLDVTQARPQ